MVQIYNLIDVTINISSNEGFGIGTLESILTEHMIIANVTGGLQDQLGFVDETDQYIDPNIHFNYDWGTNEDGRYKKHGEWAVPIFPNNRSLVGSIPTPYIFDDRCDWNEAADAIRFVYDLGPEERARRGKLGRDWALTKQVGMSADEMNKRLITSINKTFETWKPRAKFGIYKG